MGTWAGASFTLVWAASGVGNGTPGGTGLTVSPAWVMLSLSPSASFSCFFLYHPRVPPILQERPQGLHPSTIPARGSGALAPGQHHSSHPHPLPICSWGSSCPCFSSWRTETGNAMKNQSFWLPVAGGAQESCSPQGQAGVSAPWLQPRGPRPPSSSLPLASGQDPQAPCYRNHTAGCAAIKQERPRPLCCASWGHGDSRVSVLSLLRFEF